jgi:hypothetical protein
VSFPIASQYARLAEAARSQHHEALRPVLDRAVDVNLVEDDIAPTPWKETKVKRERILEISATGVKWSTEA